MKFIDDGEIDENELILIAKEINKKMAESYTDKMKKLMSICKCGIYIDINGHRDNYQSAKEFWEEIVLIDKDCVEETGQDVIDKMIKLDTIIQIQYYPETPVGDYVVFHYDLDMALEKALKTIEGALK